MEAEGQPVWDISGTQFPVFIPRLQEGWGDHIHTTYDNITGNARPYPPNTRGLLYYHQPAAAEPVLSGQLRFRLCDSPATFHEGEDLLAANAGEPWSVSLYYLVKLRRMEPLLNLILQEGSVERHVVDKVAALPTVRSDYRQLYTIKWPFVADLSSYGLRLGLLNLSMFEHINMHRLFQSGGKRVIPYAGSVKMRFEFSTLPQHSGSPILVLRFLELLEPIRHLVPNAEQYFPEPKPGALFFKPFKGLTKLWTYRLNNQTHGDVLKAFIATSEQP